MEMVCIINEDRILFQEKAAKINVLDGKPAMSSLRIAEVTGKKHKNVLKDMRDILKELEIGQPKFRPSYLNSQMSYF